MDSGDIGGCRRNSAGSNVIQAPVCRPPEFPIGRYAHWGEEVALRPDAHSCSTESTLLGEIAFSDDEGSVFRTAMMTYMRNARVEVSPRDAPFVHVFGL